MGLVKNSLFQQMDNNWMTETCCVLLWSLDWLDLQLLRLLCHYHDDTMTIFKMGNVSALAETVVGTEICCLVGLNSTSLDGWCIWCWSLLHNGSFI